MEIQGAVAGDRYGRVRQAAFPGPTTPDWGTGNIQSLPSRFTSAQGGTHSVPMSHVPLEYSSVSDVLTLPENYEQGSQRMTIIR